ncbi:MAG: hypothetical protein NTU93_06720 [Arthrobacter sp.]|nr:hypothetical protein [Arthrobacter sp.]
MKRRLAAASLSAAVLMISLSGCGQVQQAAEKAVNDGASQVATAAGSELKKQACSLVADGLVSASDKQALGSLVSGAQAAGLPAEITTPLKQIADSGDQVPANSVSALREACAK